MLCLDCGGNIKYIAKPGRMIWDQEELYEVPPELKIPTCLECGSIQEDIFVKAKMAKTIQSQRTNKPGARLYLLRHVDKSIRNVLNRPAAYGDASSVLATIKTYLEMREAILVKGELAPSAANKLSRDFINFLKKRFPKMNSLAYLNSLDLDDVSISCADFCDIWINT